MKYICVAITESLIQHSPRHTKRFVVSFHDLATRGETAVLTRIELDRCSFVTGRIYEIILTEVKE